MTELPAECSGTHANASPNCPIRLALFHSTGLGENSAELTTLMDHSGPPTLSRSDKLLGAVRPDSRSRAPTQRMLPRREMGLVAPMPRKTSPWIRRDYLFSPTAAVAFDSLMLFPTGDSILTSGLRCNRAVQRAKSYARSCTSPKLH